METNAEEVKAQAARYRAENRERIRERRKAYAVANPDKILARNARRRAQYREALCPDRDDAAIAAIYALAQQLTERFGVSYHVDHLLPLSKGGLHHERNLVVMRADMNLAKHDKIIPALIEFFG